MKNLEKLPKGLTGISGEYFVAAELSRRGFMASITLRNNDSVDIHASKLSSGKIFAIQVKTNQRGKREWTMSKKSELELHSNENFFYVFVILKKETERPEYFIVPSKDVAGEVKRQHADWLAKPGKMGQAHNDNTLRKFIDQKGHYLENWELLS
ncbi:MAG: aspartate ammonia-lyase [Mucilaginibacter sp.]|nr:aspartate ammonia-lyase [Mucilaginibacter sp.]